MLPLQGLVGLEDAALLSCQLFDELLIESQTLLKHIGVLLLVLQIRVLQAKFLYLRLKLAH